MNKEEFLRKLRKSLSGLPQDDIEERLSFYSEMIDDRMEEGLSEEEAVAGVGSIEGIVSQTVSEIPLGKLVKEKITPKRSLRTWEVILLVLGFPVWFSLLVAFCSVLFSVCVVAFSLVLAFWATDFALCLSAPVSIFSAVVYLTQGYKWQALGAVGAGVFCLGLSFFLFFGCVGLSKGAVGLTKSIGRDIKKLFIKKEKAE